MFAPTLTKKQNYRLWQSGAFGNKLRAWRTVNEWCKSGFTGLVALRTLLPWGNGPCRYNLTRLQANMVALEWIDDGIPRDSIMVNEMAPDEATILQGEYLNDVYPVNPDWRNFFAHSQVRAPMRDALKIDTQIAQGLRADLLIREAMTPASYDDWQILLEQYPGHVFEVSIYDRCLGDCPNRNALVWEIRRY